MRYNMCKGRYDKSGSFIVSAEVLGYREEMVRKKNLQGSINELAQGKTNIDSVVYQNICRHSSALGYHLGEHIAKIIFSKLEAVLGYIR
ncbi:MAG: hypothetical protein ACRC7S_15555 [Cetobacterium sp.]